MIITNIDNPEYTPVNSIYTIPDSWGGDLILVDRGNGKTERKQYHVPVVPEATEPEYKPLSSTQYINLVKKVSQMSNAQLAAYITDEHADMVYVRYIIASINGLIDINEEENMAQVVEGFDLMITHGHTGQLTAETFKPAIFSYWPTV